ncbi:MAG: DUF2213 domain-containing protein [Euryarchaeota archaeon]|nr:DUF2213 domain-containing protein [Euryarchaeota archaeon]
MSSVESLNDLAKELGDAIEKPKEWQISLDASVEIDEMDYDEKAQTLRVPVVISKEMVYEYDDYKAFRPRAELEAAAPYVKGRPVTRGHPKAGIVTDRSAVLGYAIDSEFSEDEIRTILEITNKSLIEDIRSGKLHDVSPGHFVDLDRSSSGEFEGEHYDLTQRNLYIDHIAIVPKGRCSMEDGCGLILDEEKEEKEEKKEKDDKGGEGMPGIKEAVNAVEAVQKITVEVEKEAESGKSGLEEVKKLKDIPDSVVTGINKGIKILSEITSNAKKSEEKLDSVKEKLEEVEKEPKKEDLGKGSSYPKAPEKDSEEKRETKEVAEDSVAMKELKDKVAGITAEIDKMKAGEKQVIVDEMVSLQEVRKEEDLKTMSLDELAKELEMIKAVKEKSGIAFDSAPSGKGDAIKEAYRKVGRNG